MVIKCFCMQFHNRTFRCEYKMLLCDSSVTIIKLEHLWMYVNLTKHHSYYPKLPITSRMATKQKQQTELDDWQAWKVEFAPAGFLFFAPHGPGNFHLLWRLMMVLCLAHHVDGPIINIHSRVELPSTYLCTTTQVEKSLSICSF